MNGSIVWAVIAAAGIPSAIVGILIGRLNYRIAKADKAAEEKEAARQAHEVMMIDLVMESLELSRATAEAVQRIPDAQCNGDMSAALANAKKTIDKYRAFEREQTIKNIA